MCCFFLIIQVWASFHLVSIHFTVKSHEQTKTSLEPHCGNLKELLCTGQNVDWISPTPKKAHWNLDWHLCSVVQHARSGLDLIISWRFHLQGKIDWESSSRVQGELGDIRVSVPLGPWHLFVIVTQPLLDPPSVLLRDRSGFLPQTWTWGQALSLQQLRSVSALLATQVSIHREA